MKLIYTRDLFKKHTKNRISRISNYTDFYASVGNKILPPSNTVDNLYLKVNLQYFSFYFSVVFETLSDQTRSINLFVKSTIILPYSE